MSTKQSIYQDGVLMTQDNSFNGLLFIGDPHVSALRIGRRKDDYLQSVLDKLSQAADLCHEQRLIPVCLGDLFHRNDENKITMLNALIGVLQKFPCPLVVLDGNHDREGTTLGDTDTLELLRKTGVVEVHKGSSDLKVLPLAGGALVHLYGVGHGQPLPESLPECPEKVVNVLVTHLDLAFGASYPGAQPLREVINCSLAVNGHMHDTKKSQKVGATWWHNPGNIEPLTVDLRGHIPAVWSWTPGQSPDSLVRHVLRYDPDVFDLTGLQVEAADADTSVAELAPPMVALSAFAAQLEKESASEAGRTDDASLLQEDLEETLAAAQVSEATRALMRQLMEQVKGGLGS